MAAPGLSLALILSGWVRKYPKPTLPSQLCSVIRRESYGGRPEAPLLSIRPGAVLGLLQRRGGRGGGEVQFFPVIIAWSVLAYCMYTRIFAKLWLTLHTHGFHTNVSSLTIKAVRSVDFT